jgi:hypothetical protein
MRARTHPCERSFQARRSGSSVQRMQGGARRGRRVRQEVVMSESARETPRSDLRVHARAVATQRWRRSTLSVRMPKRLAMSWGSAWT